ncbi:MAG: L,D-transpeptidase family protein [Pseudomonadales bacterium]|nr:L,D-transpeptidase family protein [Pseudomonadales bacterium]
MNMRSLLYFTACLLLMPWQGVLAASYPLPPPGSRLIGEPTVHTAVTGDFFQGLAEQYNVGFYALMAANPQLDPFLIEPGSKVTIPTQMLLPYAKREGIVINLPELRLYYFPPNENTVHVFPVGIGREGLMTPRLVSYISEKRQNPIWRPTAETRQRHFAATGEQLPEQILPGPDNPFGEYALRMGNTVYLLHGSNRRFGIGMRASAGCIRLYDDDIRWLFDNVSLNTPVRIVDQAIKMSYEPTQKLIEVHEPLSYAEHDEVEPVISPAVLSFVGKNRMQQQFLQQAVEQSSGLVNALPAD